MEGLPYRTKIGHTHLKVRNLDRAVAFYTRFLDLKVVEQVGDHYVFLSGGEFHHEIALQNVFQYPRWLIINQPSFRFVKCPQKHGSNWKLPPLIPPQHPSL